MPFIAKFNCRERTPPGRIYLHTAGLDVYEKQGRTADPVANAQVCAMQFLSEQKQRFTGLDFFLAAMWGDVRDGSILVDFFGYRDMIEWSGNPDVVPMLFRNGVYVPDNFSTCEDTTIMLGAEARLRRDSPNLLAYFERRADLGDLAERLTSYALA